MKSLCIALLPLVALGFNSLDEEGWVGEPIRYEEPARQDAVVHLTNALASGAAEVSWDEQRGWLPAILERFDAPASSQVLVFSKTSFQRDFISPEVPRALYFSDEVYIGWIPGAPVMEITTIDPLQGPTFYVVPQDAERLRFERKDAECLECHGAPSTRNWPGNLVRSVHPAVGGEPILSSGTFSTTQSSPLEERWGGWYVSGTHGEQRHMGNVVVDEEAGSDFVDREGGANVTDLSGYFDVAPYLTVHSDLVALMVLEHQAEMHNVIARANYEGRVAMAYQAKMNRLFDEPEDHVGESTLRRYQHAAGAVVDHLLMRGEANISSKLSGTSDFAAEFAAKGKRDSRGRSLRELDLERRLFSYPCSFLIHSEAFDSLPAPVLSEVWSELWEILNGREVSRDFSHLSAQDRAAILEILRETKQGLPASWREGE